MRRARLLSRLALAALSVVLIAACGGSSSGGKGASTGPTTPAAATVEIKNLSFNPATVTVKAGQTVQWNFDDSGIVHNVIGDDSMHSSDKGSGTFRHTFKHAGTFNYQCSLHASMHGVVIVQ